MDAAGPSPKLLVVWDLDNCSTADTYWTASMVTRSIKQMLPKIPFKIKAYGKTHKLNPQQRNGLLRARVQLVDVPNDKKNTADRMMIEDMFHFAVENKPPSLIMLLSGDGDFVSAFESLSNLGYTCLLVYPEKITAEMLKSTSACCYSWESLSDGYGFVSQKNGKPNIHPVIRQSVPKHATEPKSAPIKINEPKVLENKGNPTAILWDMETFQLPKNIDLETANEIINQQLSIHPRAGKVDLVQFYIHGPKGKLPEVSRFPAIRYFTTSKNDNKKHLHCENLLITNLMTFACNFPPPCNMLLITANNNLSGVTNLLKWSGYTMIVWIPPMPTRPRQLEYDYKTDKYIDLKFAATAVSVVDWESFEDRKEPLQIL